MTVTKRSLNTTAGPSWPAGKSRSPEHLYRRCGPCCFSLPGCFHLPQHNPQGSPTLQGPAALPGACGVPWLVCPGLAGPAKLGAQRPDHITGQGSGSGSGRPPTPSLFAKLLSLTCSGSRKAVTSRSRNCQQAEALRHMKVCESLAVFDSPDLRNLALESSTGSQRAAKLENEHYPTGWEMWALEPPGKPPRRSGENTEEPERRASPRARGTPSVTSLGSWLCL